MIEQDEVLPVVQQPVDLVETDPTNAVSSRPSTVDENGKVVEEGFVDREPEPLEDPERDLAIHESLMTDVDPLGERSITLPEGDAVTNSLVAQTIILRGDGFNPLEADILKNSATKTGDLFNAFMERHAEERQAINDATVSFWNTNAVANGYDIIEANKQQESKLLDDFNHPQAVEKAVVDELTGKEPEIKTLAQEAYFRLQQQEQVARHSVYNDLNGTLDQSGLDSFGDMLGMVVPFRETIAQFEIVKGFNDKKIFESPKDTLAEVLQAWYNLPSARQALNFPWLLDLVQKASGSQFFGTSNNLRAEGFIGQFMDPNLTSAQQMSNVSMVLDVGFSSVDAFGVTKLLFNGAKIGGKMVAAAKSTKALMNEAVSTDLGVSSVIDGDFAKLAGTTQHEAVNNAQAFSHLDSLDFSKVANLPEAVAAKLNDLRSKLAEKVTTFKQDQARFREGAVSQVERQYRTKTKMEELSAWEEDYVLSGDTYLRAVDLTDEELNMLDLPIDTAVKKNFEIIKDTKHGTAIQYDVVDKATGEVLRSADSLEIRWGIDEVSGTFNQTVETFNAGKWWALSPSAWAQTAGKSKRIASDFYDSYVSAARLEELSAKAKSDLMEMTNFAIDAVKGDKAASLRVQQALESGDMLVNNHTGIRGHTYTVDELAEGIHVSGFDKDGQPIPGPLLKITSEKELLSYYTYREVSDELWKLQNASTRSSMKVKNMQGVVVQGVENSGKIYDDYGRAGSALKGSSTVRIWNARTEEMINLSDDLMENEYAMGQKLVKLNEDHELPLGTKGSQSGEFAGYALVHTDDIGALPQQVIQYKHGYVPKINEGVEYLLKENVKIGVKNGSDHTVTKTLRFYGSKAQAEGAWRKLFHKEVGSTDEYIAADLATRAEMEIAFRRNRIDYVIDRALTDDQMLTEPTQASGGLFHGQRSSDNIMYGLRDIQPDRMSPFEAVQRQSAHLGNYITKNEWRIGEQQRWLNTVRQMLPDYKVTTYEGTQLSGSNSIERGLLAARKQIDSWAVVPSKDETAWQAMVQKAHDRMLAPVSKFSGKLGYDNNDKIKSVLWFKHNDLFSAAKATVFHTSLGLFNPVQLYVQSQAAVVALSRAAGTGDFTRVISESFALNMLHNIKSPTARKAFIKRMEKDYDGFGELADSYRSSGLVESIKNNADIHAMESGVGSSLKTWKKSVLEGGLIFYRSGEMLNRSMSFTQALKEFKRLNPGKKIDNAAMRTITTQARQSMLELSRANAARWQGGPDAAFLEQVAGTMLQFVQVGAKVLEKSTYLVGKDKGLNPAVKLKILAGQGAAFGLAGIPMGSAVASAMNEWTGADEGNMSEFAREAWNGGFTHLVFNWALGGNADIASRGALAGPIDELIGHVLTGGEEFTMATATPAISAIPRVAESAVGAVKAAVLLPQLLWAIAVEPMQDKSDLTKERFTSAIASIAEGATAGRNIVAWRVMNNMHKITDKYGRTLVQRDFSASEEAMRLFGFKNLDEVLARDLQFDRMDEQAETEAWKKQILRELHKASVLQGGDVMAKQTWNDIQRIYVDSIPMRLQPKVRKAVWEEIQKGGSLLGRELKLHWERVGKALLSAAGEQPDYTFKRDVSRDIPFRRNASVNESIEGKQ